ncbi:hypothetical protein EPO04_02630 [Patescibacteria group bacterium]|nr:MAG: hypothetical protein EPO04_02630 [Patescibacteria group bacterium]
MSRYSNLDSYALFYEKIEGGNPHTVSNTNTGNRATSGVPTLPKEQLAELSRDINQPIVETPDTNPHTSQQ